MSDDGIMSVSECCKQIVGKVGLAQNLERDNLHRSKQKMKEYYDRNSKEPVLRLVNVFGCTRPTPKKGYLRNYYTVGSDRTELSSNRLQLITVFALKRIRMLRLSFMQIG